jgi:ankyrin repeat protein
MSFLRLIIKGNLANNHKMLKYAIINRDFAWIKCYIKTKTKFSKNDLDSCLIHDTYNINKNKTLEVLFQNETIAKYIIEKEGYVDNNELKNDRLFLLNACKYKNIQLVKQALESGFSPNDQWGNINCLKIACQNDSYDIVKLLLEYKACIKVLYPFKSLLLHKINSLRFSPKRFKKNSLKIIKLFMKYKINISEIDGLFMLRGFAL